MAVQYIIAKAPPVFIHVLTNQINADANIGVQVATINYSAGNLFINMVSALSGPQQTELNVVVNNHNGIQKGFQVPLPVPLFDDFVTSNASSALGWTTTVASGGVFSMGSQADQDHVGVVHIGTGALPAGAASYHLGLHDVVMGNGEIDLEFMLRINNVFPGGANQYSFRIGLGDVALGTIQNGAWLEYNVQNSPNWTVVTSDGGVQTALPSNVPVDIGWHKFSLVVASDASSVQFFVDQAFVEQVTTTIPVVNTCGPIVQLTKLLGTTAATVDVDYFYFLKQTGRHDF